MGSEKINSLAEAVVFYTQNTRENTFVEAGEGTIDAIRSSVAFRNKWEKLMEETKKRLEEVSTGQQRDAFWDNTKISVDAGRWTAVGAVWLHYRISTIWEGMPWTNESTWAMGGLEETRLVKAHSTVEFYFKDEWDFDTNPGYSFEQNLTREWGPEVVAWLATHREILSGGPTIPEFDQKGRLADEGGKSFYIVGEFQMEFDSEAVQTRIRHQFTNEEMENFRFDLGHPSDRATGLEF